MDLRKSLFGNIVLSGGATLTKGFGDRLLHEVQRLAVKDMRIKIFAPPERKYSTWIGGSILAGLSTFRKVCHPISISQISGLMYMGRCGSTSMTGTRILRSFIQSSIRELKILTASLWFLQSQPSSTQSTQSQEESTDRSFEPRLRAYA